MADQSNDQVSRKHSKRISQISLRHSISKKKKSDPKDCTAKHLDSDEDALIAESTSIPHDQNSENVDFNFIHQIEQINLERERKRDLVYRKLSSEIYNPVGICHDVFASARLLEQAQSSQQINIVRPVRPKTTVVGFQALSDQVDFPKSVFESTQSISKTQLDRICNDADLAQTRKWEASSISKPPFADLSTKEAILEDFGVNSPSPKRQASQKVVQSPLPVSNTVIIKTYSKKYIKHNTSTPNRKLFQQNPSYAASPYSSNSDWIDSSDDESDDLELFHSCPDTRLAINSSPVPDPNLSGSVVGNILNLSFYYSQTNQCPVANINDDPPAVEDNLSVKSPSLVLSGDDSGSFHGFGESITLQQNFDGRFSDFSENISGDEMENDENTGIKTTPSKDLISFLQEDEDLFANFMSPVKQRETQIELQKECDAGNSDSSTKHLPKFNGFSTGLGSRIVISKTALSKYRNIFDGEQLDDLSIPHGDTLNSVIDSKPLKLDVGSYYNRQIPPQNRIAQTQSEVSSASFVVCNGFSTAKGAPIKISDNPSKRKSNIFDDFDMQLQPFQDDRDVNLTKLASLANTGVSTPKLCLPSTLQTSTPKPSFPAFQGFSTGRGVEIKLTDNTKASIFSDVDLQLHPVEHDDEDNELSLVDVATIPALKTLQVSPCYGFSTGRGAAIKLPGGTGRSNLFDDFDMHLLPVEDDMEIQSSKAAKLHAFQTRIGSTNRIFADSTNLHLACQTPLRKETSSIIDDDPNLLLKNTSLSMIESIIKLHPANISTNSNTPMLLDLCPNSENPSKRPRKLFEDDSIETPTRLTHNQTTFKTPAHLLQTPVNQDSLRYSFTQEITASTKALLEDELLNKDCPFPQDIPSKSRSINVKPTRLYSRFNECTMDVEVTQPTDSPSHVSKEVQIARCAARYDQQKAILNKNDIKMRPGSLYLKKLVSGQAKWKDFVDQQKPSKIQTSLVSNDLLTLTADNVLHFKMTVTCFENSFVLNLADGITLIPDDHDQVGILEMSSAFMSCPSIDPKLLHVDWIAHHLSLIILKLAAMERSFPQKLGYGRTLNVENTMLQLKYRYDKEIDRAERSILRKVLEKDDLPTRRMVLYVSRILSDRECELCDGHYAVRTVLDQEMDRIFKTNMVNVGTKLMIFGAELIGLDDGCFPLDIPAMVCLRISANSTRRVRWFTKLGVCRDSTPFTITLGSVLPTGGRIGRLNLCVIRIYSMLFVDKSKKDGSGTALRSERVQKRLDVQNHIQLELIEKLYSQVSHEYDKEEEIKRRFTVQPKGGINDLSEASQLFDMLQNSNDPEAMEDQLTTTQKQQLRDFQTKQIDLRADIINQRVRDRISADSTNLKISQLLKVKVIDATRPTNTAMLSVWSPHESLVEMLRENQFVQLCNASASGIRYSELQLSAGRNSQFQRLQMSSTVKHDEFRRRVTKISAIGELNFVPLFNELDTVGLVVKIGHSNSRKFQPAYLVDEFMNVMCVNFWAGLKSFAYDDLVTVGAILAVRDLQWRTISSNQTIPSTFATEFTTFTEHPKSTELAHELNVLREFIFNQDKTAIIQQSLIKIESMKSAPKPTASVFSPKTPLKSRNNGTRSLDTSIVNDILRTPAEFSPGVGPLISPVQRRIDKLSTYGEAPPLSPLVLNLNTSLNRHLGSGRRKPNSSEDLLQRRH